MQISQSLVYAHNTHTPKLMALDGVVGVALGQKITDGVNTGQSCITVLVQEKRSYFTLAVEDRIPKTVDGIVTDVIEVGELRAFSNTDKYRPAIPAGVSIGHYLITAGTYGARVIDDETGDYLMLSNNHVLANENMATLGDAILQPGPYDGGRSTDKIASLERFVPLLWLGEAPPDTGDTYGFAEVLRDIGNGLLTLFRQSKRLEVVNLNQSFADSINTVDCALARPLDPSALNGETLDITGLISGTKDVNIGQKVRKSGRTTGYTEGTVSLVNATVDVGYGANRVARFNNQFIIITPTNSPFSQGGDSGSLIVDKDENKAVGLLFAGSNVSTIGTPIQLVFDALKVHM